jgi:hypothetical protein
MHRLPGPAKLSQVLLATSFRLTLAVEGAAGRDNTVYIGFRVGGTA